ncbi:MAG: matrixin family metalloprotease, partial [Bryobacterales bacterium]|nr:matrixin family metalloprotease [Bryobacterales bacterium]
MLFGPSASAYTHFLRYLTGRSPFTAIPQKYDLNVLPNRTLSYYISDQGPTQLAPNDSLTGVISQIRAAAKVWNDVESSELRLSFGGLTTSAVPSSGPGIDVIFTDDIPPGLIAQTGFSQLGDPAGGTFVPIVRSTVMMNRNMTERPSFSEGFFLTAVHELGHAIGLQHSLVSSVMATEPTRSTSKAKPLGADDIAGLSLLYPTRTFAAATGAISGRVTLGGDGVALASVVAIPASGPAVSSLTHPDGTFRIEGIPPGSYYLYAHPLPPAQRGESRPANIEPPLGSDGRSIAPGPTFDTVFFPGGREPSFLFNVTAGGSTENVIINVQRRASAGINTVQTYNFVNQVTVKPPMMNRNAGRGTLVAAGSGLATAAGAPVAGLSAAVLANPAMVVAGSLRPYFAVPYLQLDLNLSPTLAEGPMHMLFTTGNDLYVLPAAFSVASKPAPVINLVTNAADGSTRQVQI